MVYVFLEGINMSLVLFYYAKRVQVPACQQIDFRDNEMNVRLALDKIAGLFVGVALDLRKVRLGIKAVLVAAVGTEKKLLEFPGNVFHRGAAHFILFEGKRDVQVTLTVIFHELDDCICGFEVAGKYHALVQLVPCEPPALLSAIFEIFLNPAAAATYSNQPGEQWP